MSVSIRYRIVSRADHSFHCGTSTDLDNLQRVFGDRIEEADIPTLRAMSIVGATRFYDEVADAVEKHGTIQVWGEW